MTPLLENCGADKPAPQFFQTGSTLQSGKLPLPVEVKAGKSGSLKSLHLFCTLHNNQHPLRFDLKTPSAIDCRCNISTGEKEVETNYKLINLPLYAAVARDAAQRRYWTFFEAIILGMFFSTYHAIC